MLIGLNGQIGSGKDTFYERALALADTLKLGKPERRAFADKLKRAFAALFDVDQDFIEEAKRDDLAEVTITRPRFRLSRVRGLRWTRRVPGLYRVESRMTVRLGLQRMGTEVGRNVFGESFWVDQCVASDLDHSDLAVFVTDCRFPNEAERIREAGGVVVRVLNGPLQDAGHASEQILPPDLIDFEVDNSQRGDGFASLDGQVETILTDVQQRTKRRRRSTKARKVDSVVRGSAPDVTKLAEIPAETAR